jgi:hypothetical protein
MKSYGTVLIQNQIYIEPQDDSRERRGFARYSNDFESVNKSNSVPKSQSPNFVVELFYKDFKYFYSSNRSVVSSNSIIEYSKQFKRISSGKNIVGEATNFISQFVGCEEASKLRKRIIALERIHNSVTDSKFRFSIK